MLAKSRNGEATKKKQKGKFTSKKLLLTGALTKPSRYPCDAAPGQPWEPWGPSTAPAPAIPAILLQLFRLIGAIEESAFEELHSNDSKDEHEEHINNEDVEDVLQGIHHAVKDSLGTRRQ